MIVPGIHRHREPGYDFLHTDPGEQSDSSYYHVYPQDYFPAPGVGTSRDQQGTAGAD
jgi:hypothetical protein